MLFFKFSGKGNTSGRDRTYEKIIFKNLTFEDTRLKNANLNLMSAGVLIYTTVVGTISYIDFDFETENSQMTTMIDGNGMWIFFAEDTTANASQVPFVLILFWIVLKNEL